MIAATVEVGPNLLALVLALIALATTIFNAIQGNRQRKELKPNGGSSLRDAVDRIEKHTESTAKVVSPLPPPPPPQ